MDTSSHDFVSVDMRGLKAALVARAKARRVTVSVVVRDAVTRELSSAAEQGSARELPAPGRENADGWVKLTLRVTPLEALRLAAGARAAGLSRGAYLVGLANQVPVLRDGGSRPEAITSLVASCAELSTLSRNVHQLTALLREGDVQRALKYRDMLDQMGAEVRRHLKEAAGVLASLRSEGLRAKGESTHRKSRSAPWHEA